MKITANGYVLCDGHAEAWKAGGNDVATREATEEEDAEVGGRCADCCEDLSPDGLIDLHDGTVVVGPCEECGQPTTWGWMEDVGDGESGPILRGGRVHPLCAAATAWEQEPTEFRTPEYQRYLASMFEGEQA